LLPKLNIQCWALLVKESDLLAGRGFDRAKPEHAGTRDALADLAPEREARKLLAAHSGRREGL